MSKNLTELLSNCRVVSQKVELITTVLKVDAQPILLKPKEWKTVLALRENWSYLWECESTLHFCYKSFCM